MGFRFRHSLKLIPGMRLNLSRSGPSVTFGPRGLHYTLGRRGTRFTVGAPGTGLSWSQYQPYSSRSQSPSNRPAAASKSANVLFSALNAQTFESSAIQNLVASSTSELAPILTEKRKQMRFHVIVLILMSTILAFEVALTAPPIAVVATVVAAGIAWISAWLFDQHRLTVTLEYNLQDGQIERFTQLTSSFRGLMQSRRVWRIPAEWDQEDWKRNAGASVTLQRTQISLGLSTPSLIRSNVAFLCIPLSGKRIYFAPDAILIISGRSVAALRYKDVETVGNAAKFIEDNQAPADAEVIGKTWQYVNKNGTPDRRFSSNLQLPICRYGQIDFRSNAGLNERLVSQLQAANSFVSSMITMGQSDDTAPRELHGGAAKQLAPPPAITSPKRVAA